MTAASCGFAGCTVAQTPDQTLFAIVLAHLRDGVAVLDIRGRIKWINPAFEEMFGWRLEELKGRRPQEFLLPPESRPRPEEIAAFRFDLDSPIFGRIEINQHVRRDGSRFWNQQSFTAISLGADRTDAMVAVSCRDVTGQVQAERRLRQAQVELQHAAYHDELTGLANRKKLTSYLVSDRIEAHIARCEIGMMQLDIDKFKDVNDTLGHAAGDAVLIHVAEALRAGRGPGDLICRTGGDEFLQICPGVTSRDALLDRAERLRAAIAQPMQWNAQTLRIGTSIGISMPQSSEVTGEMLIQMADQALYAAKAQGRGKVVCYTEGLGQAQLAETSLARDLQHALDELQFEIHLQPQMNLADDRITGCESLLRWAHPKRGLIPAAEFLASAERNGLLARLDYISMNLALDALVNLREAGFHALGMAINLSGSVLADIDYPGKLDAALRLRHLRPQDICVEINETSILDRSGTGMMGAVDRLKRLGVQVALDDFGTGHAGLANLSSFDIDSIKLDCVMISHLENAPRNLAVVRAIIQLADLLGMQVIAEGVETKGQLDLLRQAGCPVIQGFGIARPMPVRDFIDWLRGWDGRKARFAFDRADPAQTLA